MTSLFLLYCILEWSLVNKEQGQKLCLDLQSPDSPELRYPDPIEGFLSNLELAGHSNLATVS